MITLNKEVSLSNFYRFSFRKKWKNREQKVNKHPHRIEFSWEK